MNRPANGLSLRCDCGDIGFLHSDNQLINGALKWRQDFDSGFRHGNHVTVSQTAESININGWLDVEDHPCFYYVFRGWMQARCCVMVDSSKTNTVPQTMSEPFAETSFDKHSACGRVDCGSLNPGTYHIQCRIARCKHCVVHLAFAFINLSDRESASDVGPVSVRI